MTQLIDHSAAFSIPPSLTNKRTPAKVALVDLEDPTRSLLAECFRQFGMETKFLEIDAVGRLQKEKFEACVVKMGPLAQPVMESARTSPSNSRVVLYGIGGTVQEALKHSKYGINVIFPEPLERPAVLKLVRSTQMLVMHELRRYARVPVITEVGLVTSDARRMKATSIEISAGGMSMRGSDAISVGQGVELSLSLLTLPKAAVRGTVTWRNVPAQIFGVHFDKTDDRRLRIKEWVDGCLEG
ncbi:MAG TPA: PilZ domain-containing protein [Terriglobales bacterium]